MHLFCRFVVLSVAVLLTCVPLLPAQRFLPHIAFAYPAGSQRGTSIPVRVGGQHLDGTTEVYISGKGIRTKILETDHHYTPEEITELSNQLAAMRKKQMEIVAKTEKRDPQLEREIRKFGRFLEKIRRRSTGALEEKTIVEVTIAPDAEPGERELRLRTESGLSNPVAFHVGTLPEFVKPRPSEKEEPDPEERKPDIYDNWPVLPPAEMKITTPTIVNGQIFPGGVDRYRFQARTGQQMVFAVQARGLIPYIADAVPGWFQATVALYDAQGKRLAYGDHYAYHPDPVLFCKIPSDGEYLLEIRDAIYRGRDDFVYRIAVGELPFVTSRFPLGGPDRDKTTVHLEGWNLPSSVLTLDTNDKKSGLVPLSVRNEQVSSNSVPFIVDDLPEGLDREPNDDRSAAQAVTLPIIVNGRIDRPGDRDVFCFEGRRGEEIVVEVSSRKLDTMLDSILTLTDENGKEIAFGDDFPDKRFGMLTHFADAMIQTRLPANGKYYVTLSDAQNQGGPACAYRLRISGPRPDFALRSSPSTLNARLGTCVPLTIFALRKEGFTGDIFLALKNAPPGFSIGGGIIPANQDQVRITLSVPGKIPEEPLTIHLEGSALIGGLKYVRPIVPAEDMMQAFIYHHLVPTKTLVLSVTGTERSGVPLRLFRQEPVRLHPGRISAPVVFVLPPNAPPLDRAKLSLSEPPDGVSIEKVDTHPEGLAIYFKVDAQKAKPGLAGNLIIDSDVTLSKKQTIRRPLRGVSYSKVLASYLPAVPFQIVGQKKS